MASVWLLFWAISALSFVCLFISSAAFLFRFPAVFFPCAYCMRATPVSFPSSLACFAFTTCGALRACDEGMCRPATEAGDAIASRRASSKTSWALGRQQELSSWVKIGPSSCCSRRGTARLRERKQTPHRPVRCVYVFGALTTQVHVPTGPLHTHIVIAVCF